MVGFFYIFVWEEVGQLVYVCLWVFLSGKMKSESLQLDTETLRS